MNRWPYLLPTGLLLGFLALNAGLAYLLFPAPSTEPKADNSEVTWHLPAYKAGEDPVALYQTLKKRAFLIIESSANERRKQQAAQTKQAAQAGPKDPYAKYSKDWVLVGFLSEGGKDYMLALLKSAEGATPENPKVQRYQVDATLPGGAILLALGKDYVVVELNGEREFVFLYGPPPETTKKE